MIRARVVVVSALCALACESSPATRTVGIKSTQAYNRDSLYQLYLHDQVLQHRADTIADADPRTIAAYNNFLQTLGPDHAWWDSLQSDPHPAGVAFSDSTIARAFDRYRSVRGTVWASAVDSQVWAEHPRQWWVSIAVTKSADFPAVGRLYRVTDRRWHDVIVFRRDQLTSDHILGALRFTRANWITQGLTPVASYVLDIVPPDTTFRAGVGPITAAWIIDQLADTHGASVVLESLGILPATSVKLPIPPAVRLKGPA